MPIYEYLCDKCEREFEVEQRITDDPIRSCPNCRSRKVRRLISQTSFVLKGGGWYSDLYSSRSSKPESAGSTDAASEAKTGSEPKPAAETAPPAKDPPKKGPDSGGGKRKKADAKAAA